MEIFKRLVLLPLQVPAAAQKHIGLLPLRSHTKSHIRSFSGTILFEVEDIKGLSLPDLAKK
jgi:hypothetical protein